MKQIFEMDDLRKELDAISSSNNDKISRSSVRRWMVDKWIMIMVYLKATLIKNSLKKHSKVQSINTSVVAAIHNFLNYRIIQELGISNDDANTKFDQVMTKHISRIYLMFRDELEHVADLRKDLTVNIKDNSGFLIVLANITVKSDSNDIKYDMDLKERRFFCVVKRELSFMKYEKGMTIDDVKEKYPNTTVELHGITSDVPEEEIVVFEEIDMFYRSLPADMSHGLREMEKDGEFSIIALSDQKKITGNTLSFYECRNSNPTAPQEAVDALVKNGIYNILTKDNVDSLNAKTASPNVTMSNSLIIWDGHPNTFRLSGESNYQFLNLRHIDFNQTITKSIRDDKFASSFINNLIQVTIGDNMFNVTGSLDKLRQGITDDQRNLRDSEIIYNDLVRKQPVIKKTCILTEGDVNITAKTEKSMRDGLGSITINCSHTMNMKEVVTRIIAHQIAFIKLSNKDGDSYSSAKFEVIKELKVPKISRSYEEEEDTMEYSFYITDEMFEKAASNILLKNTRAEGPVSSISSVISVKDIVSSSFGTTPTLIMITKDETDQKLAVDSFSPYSIKEKRLHINSGCTNGEELDSSSVIKYYGSGKLFNNMVEEITVEMLNNLSLMTQPVDNEFVREYKPLEFQTFNETLNNCTEVFETKELRTNQYATILKIPRSEIHSLIYEYESIELSVICEAAYSGIATLIEGNMEYNQYFYIMLSMKYDIDSRFSNEIIAAWDAYLVMLSPYSNLEKLVIHHEIMESSKQRIVDTNKIDGDSEREMTKSKEDQLKKLKNREAYYTAAIADIIDDMDNDKLDENKNYIVAEQSEIDPNKYEQLSKDNKALEMENNTLSSKLDRQQANIDKLKSQAANKKDTGNKNPKDKK